MQLPPHCLRGGEEMTAPSLLEGGERKAPSSHEGRAMRAREREGERKRLQLRHPPPLTRSKLGEMGLHPGPQKNQN